MPEKDKTCPTPPFAEQQQPWPGLACRMQPPPDHGETSCVGSGRLGRGAAIINTSSVRAFDPSEDLLDYAATKAAILSMARSPSSSAKKGFTTGNVWGSTGGETGPEA